MRWFVIPFVTLSAVLLAAACTSVDRIETSPLATWDPSNADVFDDAAVGVVQVVAGLRVRSCAQYDQYCVVAGPLAFYALRNRECLQGPLGGADRYDCGQCGIVRLGRAIPYSGR